MFFFLCRLLTFGASQLASMILGDGRNQVTYTTFYLPMSKLIKWIRNGNKFSSTQYKTMKVINVFDVFSFSISSFDYLYRDKKLANLCAYTFSVLR